MVRQDPPTLKDHRAAAEKLSRGGGMTTKH